MAAAMSLTDADDSPFKISDLNLVFLWDWDFAHDICAICRYGLGGSCSKCCSDKKLNECAVDCGRCSHCFHTCCIRRWLNTRAKCPVCQKDWENVQSFPVTPGSENQS